FNPGSPKQMRMLMFEHLELPTQGKTPSGAFSTDGKTLNRLIVHPDVRGITPVVKLLENIAELHKASKILEAFVPAFLNRTCIKNGWHHLMGSFNLGGTVSGRLSSSGPNLTNIPSTGSDYAKMVKECFEPPKGWIFCGADFSSLEDRISALQTKDPNKIKIYAGTQLYTLTINGIIHHILEDDIIEYDGKQLTGKSFYDTYSQFRK
ncbi:MAG: hypothetical protein DRJ15_11125, partial [Bacteroidetes bacterium]